MEKQLKISVVLATVQARDLVYILETELLVFISEFYFLFFVSNTDNFALPDFWTYNYF